MPRRKSAASQFSRNVSLHVGPSFPSAWESVLLPWFERVALASLEHEQPVAVVTPAAAAANFLRERLLDYKIPLLGVKFITPAQARELILREVSETLPLREHLRLLLAIAAESVGHSENVELKAIARSIARAPDNLLRAFDRVGAAGWNWEKIADSAVREILEKFQSLVGDCGFQQVHEADRRAIEMASDSPPVFHELLLTGFSCGHWSLWPLLQAAVRSASNTTVVLEYPREQTRTADETWIGTWEQTFGLTEPVAESERDRPFANLVRSTNEQPDSKHREKIRFLVGLNTTEQAKTICAATLDLLSDKTCTRLGILFPNSGALARLVSESLTRAEIFHYDAIGHLAPGEFEVPAWNAWLDLQENHQLESLLRFLEVHPPSVDGMEIETVRDKLRRAYRDILIDDLDVLREYCAKRNDDQLRPIANLLVRVKFLPNRATLEQFLAETKTIFGALEWEARWSAIEHRTRSWPEKIEAGISRGCYLNWLKELTNSFDSSRSTTGDHRYSRVHLLSYADADVQEWSHLILAGLNQGAWPPGNNESGFLLDAQIHELNRHATRVGKQGEGHSIIENGKTFLLSSEDDRQIALRHFAAAVDSVEERLVLTASLLQESAPERFWNPSELLSHAYFAATDSPLSQQTMLRLRGQTSSWLEHLEMVGPDAPPSPAISQTRVAYNARRTADVPFGEYEFALRQPIDRKITLRATQWDKVVKIPALIWLKTYLGVENQDPDLNQWNAATGNWVHDWLAKITDSEGENVFVTFPGLAEITERIAQSARQFRKDVASLCAAVGRAVPDWWISGWGNAFALAGCLSSKMAEAGNFPRLATEWKLEPRQTISVNDKAKLRLSGRIDLILARNESESSQLTGTNLWIVDYKTGNTKSLAASGRTPETRAANLRKRLVRGDAIQLGLYGLAARELGALDIDLSILSLRTDLDRPQLSLTDLTAFSDFWEELYRIQEEGIFGLRGPIRNEFGFNPDYPVATLPIDKEFLDEKWVLTHPAFADDEEEWS